MTRQIPISTRPYHKTSGVRYQGRASLEAGRANRVKIIPLVTRFKPMILALAQVATPPKGRVDQMRQRASKIYAVTALNEIPK